MLRKILYVTSSDPMKRTSWSGVLFNIYKQLEKDFEVENLILPINRSLYNKIKKYFFGKDTYSLHSIARSKKTSRLLRKKLSSGEFDAIFAVEPSCITFFTPSIPVVYYSDSVFSSMVNYYWFNVPPKYIKEANFVQENMLRKCDRIIFTNTWAKESAVGDYNLNPDKITIVHTGANVEDIDLKSFLGEDDDKGTFCYSNDNKKVVNLLFCGADWKRKGGEIAVQINKELNILDKNRKYILHMYGVKPPYIIDDENIKIYGFLNRDNDKERDFFNELWLKSDLFISPLEADCAAASFCDACAYGVPSITFDIGGIADHVIDGYNGYRLPVATSPSLFAKKIIELMSNETELIQMKKNARKLYEEDLNWNVAGCKINGILRDLININDVR